MNAEFEIGRWILSHRAEHDLSQSGMIGEVDLSDHFRSCGLSEEWELRELIAEISGEEPERVVVTHGATEAMNYALAALRRLGISEFAHTIPEYELIFKAPALYGMKRGEGGAFIASNPNNPTGTLVDPPEGFRYCVIDETFMQFVMDLDEVRYGCDAFRINTMTKFYGGDEIRVGWVIAPDRSTARMMEDMRGILFDPVSRHSMCIAGRVLQNNEKIKAAVREKQRRRLSALLSSMGELKFYMNRTPLPGTVAFVDYSSYTNLDDLQVAEWAYSRKSVSVVPGRLFGAKGPYFRITYTRPGFEDSLRLLIEALEELRSRPL
ncbi:MAG: pyridoxal phosphate-dependent aminotransferase [Nitrososphaeria archaeon]